MVNLHGEPRGQEAKILDRITGFTGWLLGRVRRMGYPQMDADERRWEQSLATKSHKNGEAFFNRRSRGFKRIFQGLNDLNERRVLTT
jgi:hypothetical protein